MKTLDELAQIEDRLVTRAEALTGFLGERHAALEQSGVPHEYAAALTGYIDLLADPKSRLEALKRATFLVWYSLAEPGEFTGLWDITPTHQTTVLAELEKELVISGGDAELSHMLAWYIRVMGGPPFSEHPQFPTLAHLVEVVEGHEEEVPLWRPSQLSNRGQMGQYWGSLRDDA